jgi:hypothetical protein
MLLLSAHTEPPESAQSTRALARALERGGAKRVGIHHIGELDASALLESVDVCDAIAAFVRGEPHPGGVDGPWAVRDAWGAEAPWSSEGFWADERVARKEVTAGVRAELERVFAGTMHDLDPWPARTYAAIDLDGYVGEGKWVVVTNARGEQLVFSRDEIRRKKTEIVIGLDDETNLFRLLVTYRVLDSYSWKPYGGPPPLLARPVGAFLYAPALDVRTMASFALTPSSFRATNVDPLASARDLPADLITCLECHSLAGAGARARHLRASDGKLDGAFALALEEYPREVLRRFLFEQDEVAKRFGVEPIRVEGGAARQLLARVVQ